MQRAIRPTLEALEGKCLMLANPVQRLALIDETVAHLDRQREFAELHRANMSSLASASIVKQSTILSVRRPIVLNGFLLAMTTNQPSYKLGDQVVITYNATNVTFYSITVLARSSADGFNITKGGVLVWRSNPGPNEFFLVRQTIEPGHSLTFTAIWIALKTGALTVLQQFSPAGGPTAAFTVT